MSSILVVVAERAYANKAEWSYARFTATFEAIYAYDLLPIGKLVNGSVYATSCSIVAVDGLTSRIIEPERVDATIQARVWLDLGHLPRLVAKVYLPEIFWFDPLCRELWRSFTANKMTFDRKELMNTIRFEFDSLQFWYVMCRSILQICVCWPLEIDTALQIYWIDLFSPDR